MHMCYSHVVLCSWFMTSWYHETNKCSCVIHMLSCVHGSMTSWYHHEINKCICVIHIFLCSWFNAFVYLPQFVRQVIIWSQCPFCRSCTFYEENNIHLYQFTYITVVWCPYSLRKWKTKTTTLPEQFQNQISIIAERG